ncbi:hypothetical protein [Streptomyces sp. NPDC029674]|uniref:hypothetical protein n=1 Tax=Streptomyces sp. NPDC029674 TaxID=3365297 RepID=UPI00384E9AC2
MVDEKHCPTCRELHLFRRVTPAEEDHIAATAGRAHARGFWRCTNPGCLWVQPYHVQSRGFELPGESFG